MDAVQFELRLPPVSKNHAKTRGRNGELVKLGSVIVWEKECALLLGGWTAPRKPLSVTIALGYPANKLHKWDIDGRLSMLLDALGAHRDQWIDELHVTKVSVTGEGYALVTVREIRGG